MYSHVILLFSVIAFCVVGASNHERTSETSAAATVSNNGSFLVLECHDQLCLDSVANVNSSTALNTVVSICKASLHILPTCTVSMSKLVFGGEAPKTLEVKAVCSPCRQEEQEDSSGGARVGLGVSDWGRLDTSTFCEDESVTVSNWESQVSASKRSL